MRILGKSLFGFSIFFIMVAMLHTVASAQTLPANVPTNGLMAFYPFDGNANDLSGNGNHGTLDFMTFDDQDTEHSSAYGAEAPSLIADRFGNANSAYQFHGSCYSAYYYTWNASWIRVENSASLQVDTALTISFWMMQSSFAGMTSSMDYSSTNGSFSLVSKAGDGYDADPGWNINSSIASGDITLNVANSYYGEASASYPHYASNISTSASFSCHRTGDWLHCVIVYSQNKIKVYFNGTLAHEYMGADIDFAAANDSPLYFGRMGGDPWVWYPYNGALDDIGLWNRSLTDSEIAALYGDYGTVAHTNVYDTVCYGDNTYTETYWDTIWQFDFESANTLEDDGWIMGDLGYYSLNGSTYNTLGWNVYSSITLRKTGTVRNAYSGHSLFCPSYQWAQGGRYVSGATNKIWSPSFYLDNPDSTYCSCVYVMGSTSGSSNTMYWYLTPATDYTDNSEWVELGHMINSSSDGWKSSRRRIGSRSAGLAAGYYRMCLYDMDNASYTGFDNLVVAIHRTRSVTLPATVLAADAGSSVVINDTLVDGCGRDSVVAKHWYVAPIYTRDTVITAANTYTLGGTTYDTPGTYRDTVEALTTAGCDSSLRATINIVSQSAAQKPDNISSSNCSLYPEGDAWTIAEDWKTDISTAKVANQEIPLVGDLDGDGHVEIVCFGTKNGEDWGNAVKGKTILVFDATTHALKTTIDLPAFVTIFEAGPYGLVKLANGKGLIVVACYDYKLRAFDITSATPSTPYWVSDVNYGSTAGDWASNVSFADVDNDGTPEVIIRDKVYDAATGMLLAQRSGSGSNLGQTYAHYTQSTAARWQLSSPCVANILTGDAQEVILGNEIYTINITSHADASANTYTLASTIEAPSGVIADGHAQVADFNLDGNIDVLVSNRSTDATVGKVAFYVWDVTNNTTSTPVVINTNFTGKSFPLIADIDNDDTLEVVLQCKGSDQKGFRAYKYHANTATFSLMWIFDDVDEDSYANAATCFDFNQDGQMELLICDQSKMRVINGSGKSHHTGADTTAVYVLSSFDYEEVTIMQYPIIADIDGDSHAEIVSVGSNTVNVFRSAGIDWAPARPVWNQYLYNVTNVNKDLTVPTLYYSNATTFVDPADPSVVRRPYNNFLQQATTIDDYGRPFYAAPDVANVTATGAYSGESYTVDVAFSNIGASALSAPYAVTLYSSNDAADTLARKYVYTRLVNDSSTTVTFTFAKTDLCGSDMTQILVSVNDTSAGVAQLGGLQGECNTDNNQYLLAFTAPDCGLDTVKVDSSACADVVWQGETFTHDTVVVKKITAAEGGDSLVQLTLHIGAPSTPLTFDTTVCDQFVWTAASRTITRNDIVNHTFTNLSGCDSVVTARVMVNRSSTGVLQQAQDCDSFLWVQNGMTYYATKLLRDTVPNMFGCDSTVRMQLTIYYSDTSRHPELVCDSFVWNASSLTYRASTTDTMRYRTVHDCDSLSILLLTVNYTTIADTVDTASCDTYDWYTGMTLNQSGFYHDTIQNNVQCDSVIYLNLRITSNTYADTLHVDTCDSFFWTTHNATYTRTGVYFDSIPNMDGCDSISTLDIIVRHSTSADVVRVASCDTFVWTTTGQTFDTTGLYIDTIRNAVGCDSIVSLDLLVCQTREINVSSDTTIEICGSATLKAEGAYYYVWSPALTLTHATDYNTTSEVVATPRQTTTYTVAAYNRGLEMVTNGDFSDGNVGFTNDYTYGATTTVGYCSYTCLNYAAAVASYFNGRDHTDGTGKFLIYDGCEWADNTIWQQEVPVIPNTDYIFSFWGVSLTGVYTAQLQAVINDHDLGEVLSLPTTTGQWVRRYVVWNSGTTDKAVLRIVNKHGGAEYNDFGLDDVSFRPFLCANTKQITVNVHVDTLVKYVCDAYTWRETGMAYSTTGVYDRIIKTASGCDSVRRLDLHVSNTFIDTTAVTVCTRYLWRIDSNMYTVSGLYKHEIIHTNELGYDELEAEGLCDTVRYLRLTVLDCDDVPLPDNVDDPNCTTPPPANAFAMKTLYEFGGAGQPNVNSMSTPMVGDVDGDGVPEIVVCRDNNNNPWVNNGFLVIDGRTGLLKYTINTNQFYLRGQCVTMADVDHDGLTELFIEDVNKRICCYSALGYGMRWRSDFALDLRYIPMLADVNGDGTAELVAGPYIFNATTGTLLLQGTQQSTGRGLGLPHEGWSAGQAYYMQALADIDHDNQLELCAGNTIYKPVITNTTGTAGNSWSQLRQAEKNSNITSYDGQTFMADFDNDGDADVCVIGYSASDIWHTDIYVWDGQTSDLIAYKRINVSGNYSGAPHSPSIPFCGDLDGNGTPEIIFNHPCGMFALSYDDTLPNRMRIMHDRIGRFAETAGFTVFDFNQDGRNEIVYRNTTFMVIVDGVTLADLCPQLTTYSGTICEYPIVADVDADGHADIIVNSAHNPWNGGNSSGKVTVFSSQQVAAWGSARSVWNQWAYSSVNINEDMTVPQYQFDVASTFPNGQEPFNGFLRQAPHLDQNGDVYVSVSNLDAAASRSSIAYTDSGAWVSVDYCNWGDNNLIGPYNIAIYEGEYRGVLVDTFTVDETIYVDSCHEHHMFIPMRRLCHIHTDSLAVVLNDGGQGIGQNGGQQHECDTTNNVIKVPFSPVVPKADTTVVEVCDTYIWRVIDQRYDESGLYSDTIADIIGCDSVRWLNLTIHNSFEDTTNATACNQYVWPNNNLTYYENTFVTLEYHTQFGCDSIHNLHLRMHYSDDVYDTVKACDHYYWSVDKRNYTHDIVHTESRFNQYGCDSMITLVLYIYHSHTDTTYDTICQGGVRNFGNDEYREAGHYVYSIEQIPGCDTVHHLMLQVKPLIDIDFGVTSQCHLQQYTLGMTYPDMDSGTFLYYWTDYPATDEVSWQSLLDTIMVHPTLTTVYTLNILYNDNLPCPNTASVSLTPTVPVTAKIETTTQAFNPELCNLRATASGTGIERYQWFVDYQPYSRENTIHYTYDPDSDVDSTVLVLHVANGMCADSDTVVIHFYDEGIFAPSVFAPAEERIKNFRVHGTGIFEYEIFIYDRRGLLVFHSEELNKPWNGLLPSGEKAPQGTYVYTIVYKTYAKPEETQHKTGAVTLLR